MDADGKSPSVIQGDGHNVKPLGPLRGFPSDRFDPAQELGAQSSVLAGRVEPPSDYVLARPMISLLAKEGLLRQRGGVTAAGR